MAVSIIDGTLLADAKEAERQAWYRTRPVHWINDYLGIPYWTIAWSLAGQENPDLVSLKHGGVDPYETHDWAGDKDPLLGALNDLANGHLTVVCYGSRGYGKTHVVGSAASLWYLDTHRPSQWVVFAPTLKQSKDEGWQKNLREMLHQEGPEGGFYDLHPRAEFKGKHFMVEPERYGTSWAASLRPATVQAGEDVAGVTKGLHGANVVAFVEEYNEIKPAIRAGIEATLGGEDNQILVVANPGLADDALHKLVKRADTRVHRGVILDHPNCVLGDGRLVNGCHGWSYIHTRAAVPAAQRLGLDPERMKDPAAPEYPTYGELRDDPNFANAVLAEFTSVRTDTYVPASRILAVKDAVVEPHQCHERYVIRPTASVPMEGVIEVYTPPRWETKEGWSAKGNRRVLRGGYAGYTDLAGSYAVTPDIAGDKNRRDWHAMPLIDATDESVVGMVRTRGFWYGHLLCCMWLLDRFSMRYPRTPAEAERPEASWTGLVKPVFGWERNIGDIPNESFTDKPLTAALLREAAKTADGATLPAGKNGWPWKSVRHYGLANLYRDLSDKEAPSLASTFGVVVTGANREDLIQRVGTWAERLPDEPHILRSPTVLSELGTWVETFDENGGSRVDHADGAKDDTLFGLAGGLQVASDLRKMGEGPRWLPWPDPVPKQDTIRERDRRPPTPKGSFGGSFKSSFGSRLG